MISTEDKARLRKYIANPSSNLPTWVVIVIRHFIEESDESNRRLIDIEDELARTVMQYQEQISFMKVLLAYSDWYQNEDGEWLRKTAKDEFQGVASTSKRPV
jgi:hypothetical protein